MYDIIDGGTIGDNYEQLSLGEIREQLKQFNSYRVVRFVGTEYSPNEASCYRGSYDELAISYTEKEMTVSAFSKMLKKVLTQNYTGYKGGDYTMWDTTPVWAVRDSSHYSQMAIVSVFLSEDGYVYLGTRNKS